jgi:apolipoprotein N-acyltransferase
MAPFHAWPVLFLTMPLLVWLIDGSRDWRGAFGTGWWFGFGYFLLGLFWIGEAFLVEAEKYALLIPFAVTLLPAGLAVFFAAAAAGARLYWPHGLPRLLVLAVAVAATEWLRGHILTGLPWNTLGYALTYPLVLMQSASVLGTYGLTVFVVPIFAAPLVLAADGETGQARQSGWMRGLVIALVPLLAATAFGTIRLSAAPAPMTDGVRFRIVQPSVVQREKWRPENQGRIFRDHIELSRRNALGVVDELAGITHVVWPEAAMPFLPLEHPEALAEIGKLLRPGTYLFSGGLRVAQPRNPGSDDRRIYNSLLVFGHAGLAAIYDKNHLVPFGEYLPLPHLWRAFGLRGLVEMRGAFDSGPVPRPLLDIPGLPRVGALICYETIFPGRIVQGSERPGFLLSVTNDGWFGNTTGPHQHLHQARVRTVEEGLPLLRAANNGISAAFDADGRLLGRLELNVKGVIDTTLPGPRPATPYARFGDLGLIAAMALFLLAAVTLTRRAAA